MPSDLHVIDGELPNPKLPIIPGHEIVGYVEGCGANISSFSVGQRFGIPWLGWTCGECWYCRNRMKNLCSSARFTGYQINGGYAGYTAADARYCFRIPDAYSDVEAAPLLCAGLIGYRALKMTEKAERVEIYGSGAAASSSIHPYLAVVVKISSDKQCQTQITVIDIYLPSYL